MATTPERYEQSTKMLCKCAQEEEAELAQVEREAIANFFGYLDKREAALGRLWIGHHFGRHVVVPIHNKRTIRSTKKYAVEFERDSPTALMRGKGTAGAAARSASA